MHHVTAKETVGAHLYVIPNPLEAWLIPDISSLSMHNVHYLLSLMSAIRQAIIEDRFPAFIRQFFSDIYNGDKSKFPEWAVGALQRVGMDLLAD